MRVWTCEGVDMSGEYEGWMCEGMNVRGVQASAWRYSKLKRMRCYATWI